MDEVIQEILAVLVLTGWNDLELDEAEKISSRLFPKNIPWTVEDVIADIERELDKIRSDPYSRRWK
jgi:hypothetical protein